MKQSYMCKILSINSPVKDIYDVVVKFPLNTQPGQFIHILCGGDALLRRPISICDSGDGWLRFIYQVRGKGTKLLSQFKEGDELDILGPLGQGFNASKRGDGTAVVIGGGIGIYPLLKLAKALGNNTEAILGFRTKELITLEDEFKAVCDTHIATDDGSYGHHGFVTDVLKERIASGNVTSIYSCGPVPMMSAIKKIAAENGIYCQLSMEERMGCGIGMCAVCTCKSHGENVKVCQKGPVFDAEDLDI